MWCGTVWCVSCGVMWGGTVWYNLMQRGAVLCSLVHVLVHGLVHGLVASCSAYNTAQSCSILQCLAVPTTLHDFVASCSALQRLDNGGALA